MTRRYPGTHESAPAPVAAGPVPVVVVTGMSGAGKSSALRVLEDIGFEAIDNLPVSLLGRLLWRGPGADPAAPIAVGVDIRTRDFDANAFAREIAPLAARPDLVLTVLYLDCDSLVLGQRFTETRRRHPLADDRPVADGIKIERELLAPVREVASVVVDTSMMTGLDLKRLLERRFSPDAKHHMAVSVVSFAYGRGLPREADLVFDVRFLRNPHYVETLKPNSGLDAAVGAYIAADAGYPPFFSALAALLDGLLPRYRDEGKSYLTIAVGCTGGRHRSVYVAERLAEYLREGGERVHVRHRDIDSKVAQQAEPL